MLARLNAIEQLIQDRRESPLSPPLADQGIPPQAPKSIKTREPAIRVPTQPDATPGPSVPQPSLPERMDTSGPVESDCEISDSAGSSDEDFTVVLGKRKGKHSLSSKAKKSLAALPTPSPPTTRVNTPTPSAGPRQPPLQP